MGGKETGDIGEEKMDSGEDISGGILYTLNSVMKNFVNHNASILLLMREQLSRHFRKEYTDG